MIVRVAWAYTSSEENNRSFGREQSFVAGEPTNIQLMIKDTEGRDYLFTHYAR